MAAIMRKSVTDNEVGDTQYGIIARNLVENFSGDGDFGRFVFDDDQWAQEIVVHDGVASFGGVIQVDANLVGNAFGRIPLRRYQKIYKMLANPFFGGKRYIFAP